MIRIILIGLAGSLLLASGASAQQHGDTANAMAGRPMKGEMMMSKMDSADVRLDRLVSIMNKTTGGKKVQAMAAVINELVAQRKTMRAHARKMMMSPDGMMGNGMGGGRSRQNMKPTSPDTAASLAKPDTADHAQHHQP